MAKITKEAALAALKTLAAFLNAGESSESTTTKVEIPDQKTIKKMKAKDKASLAAKLGIETEDEDEIASALDVLSAVANDGEAEEEAIAATLKLLGLKPVKDAEKNVKALEKYVAELEVPAASDEKSEDEDEEEVEEVESEDSDEDSDDDEDEAEESEDDEDSDDEDSDDEDSDDEDSDDEEAEEVEEEDSDEDDEDDEDEDEDEDDEDSDDEDEAEESDDDEEKSDELSAAAQKAIAKAVKATSPADQVKQLTAYNKAADDEIEFDKKKPADGYANLLGLMIDSEDKLAKWGTAYARSVDGDVKGFCCGLELEPVKTKPKKKGEDAPVRGKCRVTGNVFEWDGEAFAEVSE